VRTEEQLRNLRKTFVRMLEASALSWSDYDVDQIADEYEQSMKWRWTIKISYDENKKWGEIKEEPKNPHCTIKTIVNSTKKLLEKYPSIFAILIIAKEDNDLRFVIDRNS